MIDVYIFGGNRKQYLPYQLDHIHKYVKDLGDINYIQGPRSERKQLASQSEFHDLSEFEVKDFRLYNGHVPPHTKAFRFEMIVGFIMDYYARCPTLFLHGDTIPIEEVSVDWLNETGCARTWNPYYQWALINPGFDFTEGENCSLWPNFPIWHERLNMQIYYPSFLHMDDYSTDTEERIQEKIEFAKKSYGLGKPKGEVKWDAVDAQTGRIK